MDPGALASLGLPLVFKAGCVQRPLSPYTNVLRSFGQDVEPIILEMPGKVRPLFKWFCDWIWQRKWACLDAAVLFCKVDPIAGEDAPKLLGHSAHQFGLGLVLTLAVRPSDVCLCHGCARSKPIKEWKACIWEGCGGRRESTQIISNTQCWEGCFLKVVTSFY